MQAPSPYVMLFPVYPPEGCCEQEAGWDAEESASRETLPCSLSPYPGVGKGSTASYPCVDDTEGCRDTANRAAVGRADGQHSLHTSAVLSHAGAVHVLVDQHGDEVGGDGDHQPIPDDSQDADGLQDQQPDSCGREAVSEALGQLTATVKGLQGL